MYDPSLAIVGNHEMSCEAIVPEGDRMGRPAEATLASQEDYPAFARWRRSEDAKEGPLAFAEKREPNWKGR